MRRRVVTANCNEGPLRRHAIRMGRAARLFPRSLRDGTGAGAVAECQLQFYVFDYLSTFRNALQFVTTSAGDGPYSHAAAQSHAGVSGSTRNYFPKGDRCVNRQGDSLRQMNLGRFAVCLASTSGMLESSMWARALGLRRMHLRVQERKSVIALEPDESQHFGRGAIAQLADGLSISVLDGVCEKIPLPDSSVDIVYARQVLHHTRDLKQALLKCASAGAQRDYLRMSRARSA